MKTALLFVCTFVCSVAVGQASYFAEGTVFLKNGQKKAGNIKLLNQEKETVARFSNGHQVPIYQIDSVILGDVHYITKRMLVKGTQHTYFVNTVLSGYASLYEWVNEERITKLLVERNDTVREISRAHTKEFFKALLADWPDKETLSKLTNSDYRSKKIIALLTKYNAYYDSGYKWVNGKPSAQKMTFYITPTLGLLSNQQKLRGGGLAPFAFSKTVSPSIGCSFSVVIRPRFRFAIDTYLSNRSVSDTAGYIIGSSFYYYVYATAI